MEVGDGDCWRQVEEILGGSRQMWVLGTRGHRERVLSVTLMFCSCHSKARDSEDPRELERWFCCPTSAQLF